MTSNASSKSRRDLLLLIAVVLANTLPFVNRAIHLDENTYLAFAHNVFRNFWFPQDFNGLWFGIPVLNFSGHTHPVGMAYFLALLIELFRSDREWMLRLGFMVFPMAYALGAYFLARRFTRHPLFTSLLIMVTPAVLVFSPTLMPDLPMATFWLFAALAFVSGLEDGKAWKLVFCGFLLVAATLVSYQAVFMAGALALYARFRRERSWKAYAVLFFPVVFLGLYWYANYLHYGFFAAERSQRYLASANIFGLEYFRQKLLGMMTTLGATTVFGFCVLWIGWKSGGWKRFVPGVVLALVSCALVPRDYSWFERGEYLYFALSGLVLIGILIRVFGQGLKRVLAPAAQGGADTVFLSSWVLGVTLYTILLCEFSAARYIAALVPPLVILFVRQVEACYEGDPAARTQFLRLTLAVTWIMALTMAYADYQFVGAYRDFSKWFSKKYPQSSGALWVGTEAGLRYYMEREGARTLVNGYSPVLAGVLPGSSWGESRFGKPGVGSLLVRPEVFLRYAIAPNLELSAVTDSLTLKSTFPFRTFGPASHAGLHGTNVGLLPIAISEAPLDRIEISRYNSFAATFEQARKATPSSQQASFAYFFVKGEKHPVVSMPVGTRLTFPVPVPETAVLKGEWGTDDSLESKSDCRPIIRVFFDSAGESLAADCTHRVSHSLVHPSFAGDFYCSLGNKKGPWTKVSFESTGKTANAGLCPAIGLWNLQFIESSTQSR
jgi:hypothetical protein